jgi:hypothetical protein
VVVAPSIIMRLIMVVAALIGVALASPSKAPPDFCHQLACPPFTVISSNNSYEERGACVWVEHRWRGLFR